jgi:hypothetical protein
VVVGESADLVLGLPLAAPPADARVHVGSDGACHVLVNGVEVGRQGDVRPYPDHREVRVHAYDLGPHLRAGDSELVLRVTNRAASPPRPRSTPPAWACPAGADGPRGGTARQPRVNCRSCCATGPARSAVRLRAGAAAPTARGGSGWTRPRPRAGVMLPVVSDVAPGPERTEWLRLRVPPGTVTLRVPTPLPVVALVDGIRHSPVDGVVRLPTPAPGATEVLLRVTGGDGRRGGAFLDGPVELELTEAEVPLVSWEELGLRALGGQVTYRTTHVAAPPGGHRTVLDLGEVRGTADVRVNGAPAARLVWGPWRADVTDHLRPGENEVEVAVRGTLAGYPDDASPAAGVYAGQVRCGLLGLVTLRGTRGDRVTGQPLPASVPPLTCRICPVVQPASGAAR